MITCSNSQGTGFFITNTLIATAKHVVSKCKEVELKNNKGSSGKGVVVYSSKSDDIAIVSTKTLVPPTVITPLDLKPVSPKQSIIVVGMPIDGLVMSEGTVISTSESPLPHSINLNVPADHGSSGGPVFSSTGIVGLIIEKADNGNIIALDAAVIKRSLDSYKGSRPSAAGAPGSSKQNPEVIFQSTDAPKLQLSLIVNFVLLGAVIALVLARKKRFSRKRIVINLDNNSPKIPAQEKEKK